MVSKNGFRSGSGEEFVKIGDVLRGEIRKLGLAKRARLSAVQTLWSEAIPPNLRLLTSVAGLSNGTLTIEVSNAALLSELTAYRKEELLANVRGQEGGERVRDIRFRLKGK